jgi:hypothetical protein
MLDERHGTRPRWYLTPRKDMGMYVSDEARKCVAYISFQITDGPWAGKNALGTAFFVSLSTGRYPWQQHVYLVTAAHTLFSPDRPGGQHWKLLINGKDGNLLSEPPSGLDTRWWRHPAEQDTVDVAVTPWTLPENQFDYRVVPDDWFMRPEWFKHGTSMLQDPIGLGDEVYLVGLFSGMMPKQRNEPVVRIGNIAMLPRDPIPSALYGKQVYMDAYLIEVRSIGGLSGSPVFAEELNTKRQGGRDLLLGLIHGHYDARPGTLLDDAVVDDLTADAVVEAQKAIHFGLAVVVPAHKIREVLDHPELVEMRRQRETGADPNIVPTPD